MPLATKPACVIAGCPARAERYGLCPVHLQPRLLRDRRAKAAVDAQRPPSSRRGYGGDWRTVRARVLGAHPVCRCGERTTEVHHVQRVRHGGTHEQSNLVALCKSCHSRITARQDARWGTQRRKAGQGGG